MHGMGFEPSNERFLNNSVYPAVVSFFFHTGVFLKKEVAL